MVTTYLDRFTGSVVADMGKQPVDAATTASIALSGYQTIDGVALNADYMRCLVKNQTDQTQNGIYVVFSSAWIRAGDFNGPSGTVNGQLVIVTGGSLNIGLWQLTTPNPVQIDQSGGQSTPASNITFAKAFLLALPSIIGGNQANSTLTLQSSSVGISGSNTDAIIFKTSNGLNVSPSSSGPTTNLASQLRFDAYGRYIQIVGTPNTSIQDSTYNGNNPLNIPNQPVGTDTSFVICGTYTQNITANMVSFTAYSNNNSAGTGGISALQGTFVGCSTTAGGAGISGSARTNFTGAIGIGLQGSAFVYAANTVAVACALFAGGDSTNPASAYLWMQSQAANNSPNDMIIIKDANFNPVQATGSIMRTEGGNHLSCAYGLKFDNATFSTAFLKSTGFMVDGSGNTGMGVASAAATWIGIGAGTTAKAQINLASSAAPTSPNNGDIWFDGTSLHLRTGGTNKTFTVT